MRFRITDGKAAVDVTYTGQLPDLFREGQGIVAIGTVRADGTFSADDVLAKHDENYMPKEVVEALMKSGRWNRRPAHRPPPPPGTRCKSRARADNPQLGRFTAGMLQY